MLQTKVKEIDEKVLDQILVDAFHWLIDTFGDKSNENNKPNYTKKKSYFRSLIYKHDLTLVWDYKPHAIPWFYYGQYAEYDAAFNSIRIHCNKKHTLEFVLDSLFHEYKHSQQHIALYSYHKVDYSDHPMEKEANEFAIECIPIFWEYYSQKVAQ
jgi:hypothetical protein